MSNMAHGDPGEACAQPAVVRDMPDFDAAVALASELKYAEAEPKFHKCAVWYEASGERARVAECLFWIGFCMEKQGRTEEAAKQYGDLMRKYPDSAASRMAAGRLRRMSECRRAGQRRNLEPGTRNREEKQRRSAECV